MKELWHSQRGNGMIMVIAFMGLAVPLITAVLGSAGGLSLDSQVKTRIAQDQYTRLAILEYVRYLLNDPQTLETWQQANDGQGSITIGGQELTFTVSVPNEASIIVDSIWQDEPVGEVADGAGVGTDTPQIRSRRSGSGDGRVYHISFTATPASDSITVCSDAFNSATGCEKISVPAGPRDCAGAYPSINIIWSPNGNMVPIDVLGVSGPYPCSGEVLVGVSHDSKTPPVDGGPLYDSTIPNN